MKKTLLFLLAILIWLIQAYAQNSTAFSTSNYDLISNFKHLSQQQLIDTAYYYYDNNEYEAALLCNSLIINSSVIDTSIEHQKQIISASILSALINYYMCDYQTAYQLLIKALLLCEKYDLLSIYEHRIYLNLGNIYTRFDKYDIAKQYYVKSLDACTDTTYILALMNNLGAIELVTENLNSAYYYFDAIMQISKRHDNMFLCHVLNNLASFYEKSEQYDSAYYYYKIAFNEAIKNNRIESQARNLSDLGNLFLTMGKTDSALYYMELSNTLAADHHFFGIMSDNYLILSQIEETCGRNKSALMFYKEYAALKDSVFNTKNFGDINQLQRQYEVSKTNQQIEQLLVEHQIKERTIYYRTIILFFALGVLLFVVVMLVLVFVQKQRLNTAYKALFEKNMEIINLQKHAPEKYRTSALNFDMQEELLNKILMIMEETSVICDTEFSIDRLVMLTQSNNKYISQVINTMFNKNFRQFLNAYRIREAQRLFSEPDAAKYTIDAIALKVGFKSKSSFYDAFKEITGVSPNFYLKSMQMQRV